MQNITPHKRAGRQCGGFTLVEVVVASALVGLSLSGVWGLLNWLMYSTHLSGKQVGAGYLAETKMEQLLSTTPIGGTDSQDGFTRTWSVSWLPNNQRRISVVVQWTDPRNRTHAVDMQSSVINAVTSFHNVAFSDLFVGATP